MNTTTLTSRRDAAVRAALHDIRKLTDVQPFDRVVLTRITMRLEQLAAQKALFPTADFAPPAAPRGTGGYKLYRLNAADGDQGLALYLNALNPGERSMPHDHTTWVAIVALQGQEVHRIYRRADDGSDPSSARLALVREITVEPGTAIGLMPDELHSIHAIGESPLLHLHLYGRPLEKLSRRIGVDMETGAVVNYNAALLAATKAGQ